jgi:hypothetical protein
VAIVVALPGIDDAAIGCFIVHSRISNIQRDNCLQNFIVRVILSPMGAHEVCEIFEYRRATVRAEIEPAVGDTALTPVERSLPMTTGQIPRFRARLPQEPVHRSLEPISSKRADKSAIMGLRVDKPRTNARRLKIRA